MGICIDGVVLARVCVGCLWWLLDLAFFLFEEMKKERLVPFFLMKSTG